MMNSRVVRWALLVAAIALRNVGAPPAWAEGNDPLALAAAVTDATATLQGGLKAAEREGTPISAKFEIDEGKLQLSVYTTRGDDFTEVVADPKTGAVTQAEKIKEADDLKEATAQKTAMAKTRVPLASAVETAINANPGFRAISIYPQLQDGSAVAEVTLLQGMTFKKVIEKLD
jgi:hypothetical protein